MPNAKFDIHSNSLSVTSAAHSFPDTTPLEESPSLAFWMPGRFISRTRSTNFPTTVYLKQKTRNQGATVIKDPISQSAQL